jgi:hypothetical protein
VTADRVAPEAASGGAVLRRLRVLADVDGFGRIRAAAGVSDRDEEIYLSEQ